MSRTGALAALALVLLVAGVVWATHRAWRERLACDVSQLRWVSTGRGEAVAVCPADDAPTSDQDVPAGIASTLGRKVDLNRATEDELGAIPGVGRRLAKALVDARQRTGRFESWADVDAVDGVGVAKLELLQAALDLAPGPGQAERASGHETRR